MEQGDRAAKLCEWAIARRYMSLASLERVRQLALNSTPLLETEELIAVNA